MQNRLITCGVVASIVVAFAGAMLAQPGMTVPSAVLSAADGSPVEFAMALANSAVPAGLEVREADDRMPPNWPTINGRPPAWFDADRTKRVSATDVVEAFNRERRDYQAVLMGPVVVIRPVGERLAVIDQASPILGPTPVTGVMTAARRVFSDFVPGLTGPTLNSYGRKGEDLNITLDGSRRTVVDTLNQIVLQAGPRAWVVTTRQEGQDIRLASFGFIDTEGNRRTQEVSSR